jgi:conjugal transfer pilus assembly protein TrbC
MEKKKLLFFVIKNKLITIIQSILYLKYNNIIAFILFFRFLAAVSCSEELQSPVFSENEQEAIILKAESSKVKQEYLKEAKQRAEDTKNVMTTVIQDASKKATQKTENPGENNPKNKNKPPCLGASLTEDGKCSVTKTEVLQGELGDIPSLAALSEERILVFVSFSMPEASLKHLCETLKDHPEVTLVLRGLIEDSMEKTARKIDEIKGVFEINPELFEQYDVQTVPTFVLVKKDKPVAMLKGNITLTYAKALFAEKGTYVSSF